ncbi:hypothetical protein [Micromonospora sp. NPDC047074]|uniref:hypothetical protein n=1 Tax=Micromonospora sp. NPDC047074 TaxID=3154339 RepID=UPI0033F30F5D
MAVRRHVARFATVSALLCGLVALGATPALAAGDLVRVRSSGSFTAGGSAGGASIEVRKRSDGCVLLRTALGLRLAGLPADQARVQVSVGGSWFPVPVSGSRGSVATAATSPLNPRLCKGKSITVRYRVAFASGVPSGRLTVVGAATDTRGRSIGRAAVASKVVGGRATPSPSPSKKPSPSPSATAGEAQAGGQEPTMAAVAGQGAGATNNTAAEESSSGGSMIMFFGIAMVLAGILLIVLLFRRSRGEKEPADDLGHVPLPRNPGGTTYRSGQGPAAAPGPPGQVYGGQQPATGGLYGGGPSAPRPAGGVYGGPSVPEATQVVPGAPGAPPVPPPSGAPAAPPSGAPSAPPPGAPGAVPPAPGWHARPPAPGKPGEPPEAGGGDHTVYMPRLPG